MARPADSSEGDEWVDVDDESDEVERDDEDGLSPIEELVRDQEDAVGDMFDPNGLDDDED